MPKRDYYEVLGIARDASAEDIRKAYRKLAREHHPDRNKGNKLSETKFKEVQEAYDVLGEPEKRTRYDQFGQAAFEPGAGPGPGFEGFPGGGRFDFRDLGGLDEILGGIFGGGGGKKRRGRATADSVGQDIQAEVTIPFKTACLGGELEIVIHVPERKQLTIKIPPGIVDGDKLRLAGKGGPAPTSGGKPGNLVVVAKIDPHPFFNRKENDIFLDAPITIGEAALGTSIDVPTLDGSVSLTVPAGTSSGQKLRLRGKGVPTRDGGQGDMYVQLKVIVPKNLDEQSRRLIQEFAERNPQKPRQSLGWS